jgi:hypothetical protein
VPNNASGGSTGLPNNTGQGYYAFNNANAHDEDLVNDWYSLWNIDDWETLNRSI